MDLESDCSALEESVEDNNEVITTLESLATNTITRNVGETITEVEINGTCDYPVVGDDEKLLSSKGKQAAMISPVLMAQPQSPGGSIGSSPPAPKGVGLKKWRRIRREVNADGTCYVDSSKALKRGLSNSAANSPKLHDMRQKNKGSVSSTNAVVRSQGVPANDSAINMVGGPVFSAGTDSENSEDWSSKSSTAASAPRQGYAIPAAVGYGDKSRTRSLSGKNLGNTVQQWGKQGKGHIETSKKHRGERIKIEKENSHSSMESDSRSSNFVFMQGTSSVTSNGRQSGRSAYYDGENSDDAQGGEQQFCEELQTGFRKNMAEFEDVSQEDMAADLSWGMKEEKSDNHASSADRDPLIESIITLQSAQEALEKELRELREIGKEDSRGEPSNFTYVNTEVREPSASEQWQSGGSRQNFPDSLESPLISLRQNAEFLESKLEKTRAILEVKEAKVNELEAMLKSPKDVVSCTVELQEGKEMLPELEGLFKQKVEAEVEYLVMSRTIQKLRVAAVDQLPLLEKQKTLASERAQVMNKLEVAESKVILPKFRAEKLDANCGDAIVADEVLKLQKRVCKYTSCFFMQLILLVVVLGLFVLQLSPYYSGVVPT